MAEEAPEETAEASHARQRRVVFPKEAVLPRIDQRELEKLALNLFQRRQSCIGHSRPALIHLSEHGAGRVEQPITLAPDLLVAGVCTGERLVQQLLIARLGEDLLTGCAGGADVVIVEVLPLLEVRQ